MLHKILDLIIAVCIMFLFPVRLIFVETEQLREKAYLTAIGDVIESIRCQGYIGQQHYERLSELSVELQQPELQMRYYAEPGHRNTSYPGGETEIGEEQLYHGEKVAGLKTGGIIEWCAGEWKGIARIRSGLKERKNAVNEGEVQ